MKKIILFLSAGIMLFSFHTTAAAGLDGFEKVNVYTEGQFNDVPSSGWYAGYIQTACEYGLMDGVSDTSFNPEGNLTVGEAVEAACRLHRSYHGNHTVLTDGTPWYQPYVDYAVRNHIIQSEGAYDYESPVTCSDFALFISRALPDDALPQVNDIKDGDIPGLSFGSPYHDATAALENAGVVQVNNSIQMFYIMLSLEKSLGVSNGSFTLSESNEAVYRLYRAGVMTGDDAYGTFSPQGAVTRGCAAAILSRTAEPSLRQYGVPGQRRAALVPMNQLANLASLQKGAGNGELAQAYEAARKITEPLAGLSREAQLCGITIALRIMSEDEVSYSDTAAHYNDPYGFFILHTASCAGCTRAVGLCLNMLGIPYEHVNENQYSHQWARVNVNGTYWICDAYGLYCGPEEVPYGHP
ncbi:MAG: S-layer homology domain-containing protein [Clostridium sp.]|jgi:hypothetical protein|nr:S-layer homology domain-containing protein [Clostridium sp.]